MIYIKKYLLLVIFLVFSLLFITCNSIRNETSNHHHHHHHKKHHKSHQTKQDKKPQNVFNVDDYGAKGDGETDDSEAFKKAWNKFCESEEKSTLVIPNKRTYLLKPISFHGPCYPNLKMKVQGTIKASNNKDDYENDRQHWIKFKNLRNFKVEGGGVIDGNGHIWWKESCKVLKKHPCDDGTTPFAVTFQNVTNTSVKNLKFKSSQRMHLVFSESKRVRVSRIVIQAPEDSPNTDGIHISRTTDVDIKKCTIGTGDDCISIVNGSKNVRLSNIVCGPGHGISIGSLGKNEESEEHVSNVHVNKVVLKRTTNGVRIKTWQGGKGYARNIMFEDIVMHNVTNPIIIDQYYCDKPKDKDGNVLQCPEKEQAVKVSNVIYKNIRGTSARELGMRFRCSKTVPCQGILMQNVNLRGEGYRGDVKAECSNVNYAIKGNVSPICQDN